MNGDLELTGVSKAFGRVQALRDVSLRAPAGTRLAVVGPSGSGKTTLLRMVAGFDAPDAGIIRLGETCLAKPGFAAPAHKRDIGIVSQDGALFPHLSIADNVGFGLPRNAPGRDREIAQLIEMVGLDLRMLARKPDEISGGQQQRVALARALARRPRLMLLDEPFSALDTGLRASTRRAVSDLLKERAITTVLVTHDQGEALSFADQVAVMHGGCVLQAGHPRDLYFRPATSFVAEFLGESLFFDADCRDGRAHCTLGSLPVSAVRADGPARIMLRPEQIALQRISPSDSGLRACRIESIEFGGAKSIVALRLIGAEGENEPPLVLKRGGLDDWRAGDVAAIVLSGTAHAFA